MLVAEETEEASVGETRKQYLRALGLRDRVLRLERLSVLVAGLEVFAVEREMRGVLAREHGVRLRAGGDEDRVRRQPVFGRFEAARPAEADAAHGAVVVHVHGNRRKALGEGDAFLERLFHFLVIERIGGTVDEAAPVGDGDAAPMSKELDNPRVAAFAQGPGPFLAHGARVSEELLGDLALLIVPFPAGPILADLGE